MIMKNTLLVIIQILGALVFIIGLSSVVVGRIMGEKCLYAWGNGPMPLNSSIGFMIIGLGLYGLAQIIIKKLNGKKTL